MALVCADFMTFYKRSEIGAVGWVLPVLSIHAFIPTHSLRVPRSMCAPRHRPASSRVALVALYTARDLMPGEELFVHYGEDIVRRADISRRTTQTVLTLRCCDSHSQSDDAPDKPS